MQWSAKKNILLFIIEKIFKRNNSYNGNSDELTHHLKLTETKLHNTFQKYAYSKFKCFCPTRTVWKLMAHITRNSSSIICNGIKCKARIVPLFTFQFSTHILIFSRCKYSIWKLNFWPINDDIYSVWEFDAKPSLVVSTLYSFGFSINGVFLSLLFSISVSFFTFEKSAKTKKNDKKYNNKYLALQSQFFQ